MSHLSIRINVILERLLYMVSICSWVSFGEARSKRSTMVTSMAQMHPFTIWVKKLSSLMISGFSNSWYSVRRWL